MAAGSEQRSDDAAAQFEAVNMLRGTVESAEYKDLVIELPFLKVRSLIPGQWQGCRC